MNLNVEMTPEGIAKLVRDVALHNDSADFSSVTAAIDTANENRAQGALHGMARLELPKVKARPFILAYLRDGKVHTARGVEFLAEGRKKQEDDDEQCDRGYSVLVDDYGHPFYSRYRTIAELCRWLEHSKFPYHFEYAD
jgi:hypothetical protein